MPPLCLFPTGVRRTTLWTSSEYQPEAQGQALLHIAWMNTRSGERSQEITFDYISAEAGIGRRAQTIPGHQYQIEAWGKHVRSASPVELSPVAG